LIAALWPSTALAHMPIERPSPRRTNTAQLTVAAERRVLPNGLVVILSPDDAASTVVVNIVFRAGTVYEPPNRNGMAHMAEHVMFRGTTPDADYYELLEQRGALDLGAFTGHETMNFITVMPPQELPVALWVIADRMGHLPGFIDRADLSQHLKIVLAERNERNVDREYGAVDELIDRTLFPEQHPLHSGIGGTPASLGAVNASDIKAFVERLLVPANAVLVVTGRFDPAVASQLVDQYLAGLAPGVKAANPALPRTDPEGRLVTASELLSREPRITLAWRVAGQRSEALDALEQGAVLLTLSTDGAFGTRVAAGVARFGGEAEFRMDVTLPYDKPQDSAIGEAEVFLRYLTMVDMDRDLLDATNLFQDRLALFGLDDMRARAGILAAIELDGDDPTNAGKALERHWSVAAPSIQETAKKLLKHGRLVIHAQPTRPRQPKVERE